MIIEEIRNYVQARVGTMDDNKFFNEANACWKSLWYTKDVTGCLWEVDLMAIADRVVTAPWFVHDIRGVRHCTDVPVALMSPRPYYNDLAPTQHDWEWRLMHKTPLLQPIGTAGQLTLKPRRRLATPTTITLRGIGEFGVTEIEDVTLTTALASATTSAVYSDIISFTKPNPTNADIELYDIANNKVALLPADRTDVFCQTVRLSDTTARYVLAPITQYFTMLYKSHPTQLIANTDAIADEFGMILQSMLVENILAGRVDAESQKASLRVGATTLTLTQGVLADQGKAQQNRMSIAPNTNNMAYQGYL